MRNNIFTGTRKIYLITDFHNFTRPATKRLNRRVLSFSYVRNMNPAVTTD